MQFNKWNDLNLYNLKKINFKEIVRILIGFEKGVGWWTKNAKDEEVIAIIDLGKKFNW
jgi:hypothetical protein